jgi:hypothetical protein
VHAGHFQMDTLRNLHAYLLQRYKTRHYLQFVRLFAHPPPLCYMCQRVRSMAGRERGM